MIPIVPNAIADQKAAGRSADALMGCAPLATEEEKAKRCPIIHMMASTSSKGVSRHSPSSRVATETRLLGWLQCYFGTGLLCWRR